MENITEILKTFGLEIPEDKKNEFAKKFNENYKTVNEFNNKIKKLEMERDDFKTQLDTANTTLEGFADVNVEDLQKQIKEYKETTEQQKKDFEKRIAERDFEDALVKAMEEYKFTSNSAKEAVMNQIRAAELRLVDGKIMGLNDMMENIKTKDAGAFVDEKQQELERRRAKFTSPELEKDGSGKKISPSELMKLKNENPDLNVADYI